MSRIGHIAVLLTLGLAACGGRSPSTNTNPFAGPPMMSVQTKSGKLTIAIRCSEDPLTFGVREFEFTVTDASGTPQPGLTIKVKPWAPYMGHGSSTTPTVTDLGHGVYDVKNVYFTMPGQWELIDTISAPTMDSFTTAVFDVS